MYYRYYYLYYVRNLTFHLFYINQFNKNQFLNAYIIYDYMVVSQFHVIFQLLFITKVGHPQPYIRKSEMKTQYMLKRQALFSLYNV